VIYLDASVDLDTVISSSPQHAQITRRRRRRRAISRCTAGIPSLGDLQKRANVPPPALQHSPRIPAIVGVVATAGPCRPTAVMQEELHVGAHGYTPATRDMGALFVAADRQFDAP